MGGQAGAVRLKHGEEGCESSAACPWAPVLVEVQRGHTGQSVAVRAAGWPRDQPRGDKDSLSGKVPRCSGSRRPGAGCPAAPDAQGSGPRRLCTASPDPEQGQRPCVSSSEEGRLHQVGFVTATPYQPRVACSPFLDIVLVSTKLCLSSHSLLF